MKDKKNDLKAYQYKRMLEERKGHNYQYYTDDIGKELEEKGYEFYLFTNRMNRKDEATQFEHVAKEVVEQLRNSGHFARIICGYDQNVQRIKMYSVV